MVSNFVKIWDIRKLGIRKIDTNVYFIKPSTSINCNFKNTVFQSIRRHLTTHENSAQKYGCSLCPKRYKSFMVLRLHFKQKHEIVEMLTLTLSSKIINQVCIFVILCHTRRHVERDINSRNYGSLL